MVRLNSFLRGIKLSDPHVCDVSQVEDLLEVSEGVVRLCDLFVALIVAFSTVLRDILELGFDVVYLVLNFLSLLLIGIFIRLGLCCFFRGLLLCLFGFLVGLFFRSFSGFFGVLLGFFSCFLGSFLFSLCLFLGLLISLLLLLSGLLFFGLFLVCKFLGLFSGVFLCLLVFLLSLLLVLCSLVFGLS